MNLYQLATVAGAGPQSIPDGFGGLFDWSAIDDDEKARRGWVRFAPPATDAVHDRIETAFTKGEDGIWRAAYTVVAAPPELALAAAREAVATRRWDVQTAGVSVPIGGKTTRFLSTKEGQSDVGNALQLGTAAEAQGGAGSFAMTWKSLDGFVTVKLADLAAIGMAIGTHVGACFAREAAIVAKLDKAAAKKDATAYTVRDVLAAEIDKGWPE